MKKKCLKTLSISIIATLLLPTSIVWANHTDSRNKIIKVSVTNISNVVFTPPIIALCKKRITPIATLGLTASDALEALAEGGNTSELATLFDDEHCNHVVAAAPILPGETLIFELMGRKRDYLHMASMLLPTNDGFTFTSGYKVRKIKRKGQLMLTSYDAGTEFNDEMCANIPGPQCGGEGFNQERETNNFVKPHAGIQGVADVSASQYNWGDPVAYIRID